MNEASDVSTSGRVSAAFRWPGAVHIAVVALLVVGLALLFWRVTFEWKVLSSADILFTSYPWKGERPEDFERPDNPYQSDDAQLFFPRRHALYEGDGDPWRQDDYLAGDRNGFYIDSLGLKFYPPSVVFKLFSFEAANTLLPLAVLLSAGVSMYLFLTQLRFPWQARAYGALLYMLNGHFVVWLLNTQLPAALAIVPLILFGLERYVERRNPLWLLVAAGSIAVQVYIAYIPAWVLTGIIVAFYAAARLGMLASSRRLLDAGTIAVAWGAAGLLAIGLSAYSLVPSVSSAAGSNYQESRSPGLAYFSLEQAWTYLFPDYWGTKYNWLGPIGNYQEAVGYLGITALPLAALGFWYMRQHWLGWFALALLVFSATQLYGIPPLKELAQLPGLKQVSVGRWIYGMNLAAALMAPAGVALLFDREVEARQRRMLVAALGAMVALALIAVGVLYIGHSDDAPWLLLTEGKGLVDAPWEIARGFATQLHRQIAFLLLGAAATAVALLRPQRAGVAAVGLIALLFADLFAFGQDYNSTVTKPELYPETPAIEFLKRDSDFFRIAPVASDGREQVMPGYTANVYGLNVITGYDHYRNEDYLDFLAPMQSEADVAIVEQFGYVTIGGQRQELNRNLLSMLGVKYVVTGPTGLWSEVGEHAPNETAYPVYGEVTQGTTVSLDGLPDAVEFLLATGGRPGPESDIVFHIRDSVDAATDVAAVTIDGAAIEDNSWQVITLPPSLRGDEAYIEVEAPQATAERPLLLWGAHESPSPGLQRIEAGEEVPGALTLRRLQAPREWAQQVYTGPDAVIYRVVPTLQLAWGVRNGEIVATREEALARITEQNFNPRGVVLFAEEDFSGAPVENGGVNVFSIAQRAPDELVIEVDSSSGGYVVLSQRYDAGWKATVDGEGTEVLRADNNLQAVEIPAGAQELRLTFEPDEYEVGRAISMGSGALVVIGVFGYLTWGWYGRRRRGARDWRWRGTVGSERVN